MVVNPVLEKLRERINCLEETQRRFSRTISVADVVDRWMPRGGLPAGCIHEIKSINLAGAIAFSSVLSARVAQDQGNILYIATDRSLHPIGLLPYGMRLDRLLYVSVKKSQDLAWATMEALRCSQVSAVIAMLDGLNLIESRRLQLAAETSGATAFLLGSVMSAPIASPITRWKISSVSGKSRQRFDEPLWGLDLLYCRGGRPGRWMLQWQNQKLTVTSTPVLQQTPRKAMAG